MRRPLHDSGCSARSFPKLRLTLRSELLTLESVLRSIQHHSVEGFLSLALRSLCFAAVLGLLAAVCLGQDPVPPPKSAPQNQPTAQPSQPPQAPSPQSDTQDQNSSSKAPPDQDSTPAQAPADNSSTSKPAVKPPVQSLPPQNNQVPITLESSETIFAVLTALNACGYDQDLTISDPTRSNVRADVQHNLRDSEQAEQDRTALCDFAQNHVVSRDPNRNLSQYISLALYMDGPPHFVPRVKEDELPPDAYGVARFGSLLERFYASAGLHGIWERHRRDYAAVMQRYHEPLAKMVFDTRIYLKETPSQYLGRRFTIYLDFMGSPNETDARNYGTEYYVIVFPAPNTNSGAAPAGSLKMDQIRHTFLHYELDPLAEKHYSSMKRLEPLLQSVKRAPLEDSFKGDISLLVNECMIRAIEIRTAGNKQTPEALRAQAIDDAVKQGYILTRYFYNAVMAFEKDDVSLHGVYSDLLDNIDVKKEEKAAAEVQFASVASPELVRLSRPEERRLLITAEKRLAAGDPKGAQELAQQAIDKKVGDQGRALFILAEVAVANKNRDGAQENFQKAIASTSDPTVVAWSHLYLGRILDMKEQRDAAVQEYRAALTVGGGLPEIKAAAEKGLAQAYEPPAKPQERTN
jgi:tetratricopeptide (TPR) repeat protein